MNPTTEDPASSGWHLDKRVPIALIVTLLLQAAVGLIWASKLDARVASLELAQATSGDQPMRIVRVETQMEGVRGTLKEMNDKLDRLLGYPAPAR
ncbi:hypothetical protein [Kaistia sp. MMO-174]|uniref:hypothetical protein n=1 Tax=Kaistia sp. MMO-174 TaxID=3081256 RepID=UPI00301823A4